MRALPQQPAAVLIGPNSKLFGSKLHATEWIQRLRPILRNWPFSLGYDKFEFSRSRKSCSHSDSLISTTCIFHGSTFFRLSNAPIALTSEALLSFPDLLSIADAPSAALPSGKSPRFRNRYILLFHTGSPSIHVGNHC